MVNEETHCMYVLFISTINTFYLWLYGIKHMVKDHSNGKEETHCPHMGYSFRLSTMVLLYTSYRQYNTWPSLLPLMRFQLFLCVCVCVIESGRITLLFLFLCVCVCVCVCYREWAYYSIILNSLCVCVCVL